MELVTFCKSGRIFGRSSHVATVLGRRPVKVVSSCPADAALGRLTTTVSMPA
jgi:hypothetical protein